MRTLGGLDDVGFGLGFGLLELGNVAIEFPYVLSNEGVAFPFLEMHGQRGARVVILWRSLLLTCSSGVGLKKSPRTVCMITQDD